MGRVIAGNALNTPYGPKFAPLIVELPTPAKPEIDETRPHMYVYMIRDLGAKRKPAGFITVGSLLVFLMLCYLLHTRDRRVIANRSAKALPVQTSSPQATPARAT